MCGRPYLVILMSVLLCGVACAGFGFYNMETDDELLWTPFGSPASVHDSTLFQRFCTNFSRKFGGFLGELQRNF